MEPVRRGRKRSRNEIQKVPAANQQSIPKLKKPKISLTKYQVLLGQYVKKKLTGRKIFIGKIVHYDKGLYRVDYENGASEDLVSSDLRGLIVRDDGFKGNLLIRKKKLDELLSKRSPNVVVDTKICCDTDDSTIENDSVVNSYRDSSEHVRDKEFGLESENETLLVLPPSSGIIGVPDEYISQLFSVYSFLRSFSIRLFLSPFSLDDFAGSLNCCIPNTLLDAIHVALMGVLKLHLESLSLDGSEQASKCLRCIDWSLLDILTWPVYLVHYLFVMRFGKRLAWKGFYTDLLNMEYYTLVAGKKLMILQMLCDDALDFAELRTEIDMREELEFGIDVESDMITTLPHPPLESDGKRVHPQNSKTSGCKEPGVMEIIDKNHEVKFTSNLNYTDSKGDLDVGEDDMDENSDECRICGMDGTLLCCDGCPSVYHSRCIGVSKLHIPEGSWFCHECNISKTWPSVKAGTSLRGGEIFGTDSYGHLFLGACSHLLVLKTSSDTDSCLRYYNQNDIPNVLQALHSSMQHTDLYSGLCRAILQYWKIPENILALPERAVTNENITVVKVDAGCPTPSPYPSGTGSSIALQTKSKIDSVANTCEERLYMGSSFKTHSYFNHYSHGEFAASAAANLAVLLSEENQVLDVHGIGDSKKTLSTDCLLQVKVFLSTATRFFWPSSEKRHVEVPRERCGWCLACKAPASNKKGCLLNAAALNATRSAMKTLSMLRPTDNGEGCLPRIITYILYLEVSLRGLMVGPFLNASYRTHWQKQVHQASTFNQLKFLLLELEENIRSIAFSPEWAKLVHNFPFESSVALNASSFVGTTQKRGPSARQGRKPLAVVEAVINKSLDASFCWWRGWKLSKFVFQNAILPRSVVKKASRIGGKRMIHGIDYAEGYETPRSSRQFMWRAAVEMSNNASQFALQVRYLDLNVKWSDLGHAEQNFPEGKGAESEASAFRNGLISDKKTVENKIVYGVSFGNQKYLTSRIMKNSIEVEPDQDGKDKFWFSEARIPLYLIKEYEMNAEKTTLPSVNYSLNGLSKLQRTQLKASRRDAISYLIRKRDNCDKCSCDSCKKDVILGNAVTCSACQGYCHESCTTCSTHSKGEVESLITYKKCYVKTPRQNESRNDTATTPLLVKVRDCPQAITISPCAKLETPVQHLVTQKSDSRKKLEAPDSSLLRKNRHNSWGLIWKKGKKSEDMDIGTEFRLNHILLKGATAPDCLEQVCHLCRMPYKSDLVYIHCETCYNWFHGDAVELDESKISELLGFKCCRCRRIKSPVCPYMDPKSIKPGGRKIHRKDSEQRSIELHSVLGTMSQKSDGKKPMTHMLPRNEGDSVDIIMDSQVKDLISQGKDSRMGMNKLLIRRHVKPETDVDGLSENILSPVELSASLEVNDVKSLAVEASCPLNKSVEERLLNHEDIYFSVDELMGSEDDEHIDCDDTSVEVVGNVKGSCTIMHEQFLEFDEWIIKNDELKPKVKANTIVNVVCHKCSNSEPAPDLFCQTCSLLIHSQCSPWEESSSGEENWHCGNCREWK